METETNLNGRPTCNTEGKSDDTAYADPGITLQPLLSANPKIQWQTLKNPIDRITETTFATERILTTSSGNHDPHTTNTGYEAMTPIK